MGYCSYCYFIDIHKKITCWSLLKTTWLFKIDSRIENEQNRYFKGDNNNAK